VYNIHSYALCICVAEQALRAPLLVLVTLAALALLVGLA
jgi:hypothetical protein